MGFRLLGGSCLLESAHREHASSSVAFDSASQPFCVSCALELICRSQMSNKTLMLLHDLNKVSCRNKTPLNPAAPALGKNGGKKKTVFFFFSNFLCFKVLCALNPSLSSSQVVRLVDALLSFDVEDENFVSVLCSLLEAVCESEHASLVVSQALQALDSVLSNSSIPKATVLMTFLGRLLSRPRAMDLVKAHGQRLVHAARHLLEFGSDAARSSCYFVLLKLVSARDAAALRFGVLPSSWECICSDVLSGSTAGALRSNGLALLCFLLQFSNPSIAPWPKIVDALKVVISAGEAAQQSLASQILLEAVDWGFAALLLEREVGLHVLEALSRHESTTPDVLRKLVQLMARFSSPPLLEALRLQLAAERVVEVCTSLSQIPALVDVSMELLLAVLPLSPAVIEPAAAMVWSTVRCVQSSSSSSQCWLAILHHLAEVRHAVVQDPLVLESVRIFFAPFQSNEPLSASPSSVHLVGLGLSLGRLLDDEALVVGLASSQGVLIGSSFALCLEVARACEECSSSSVAVRLFPLVLKSLFDARRSVDSSQIGGLVDRLLAAAKRVLPFWQIRVPRVHALTLALPDLETWRDDGVLLGLDSSSLALALGLMACNLAVDAAFADAAVQRVLQGIAGTKSSCVGFAVELSIAISLGCPSCFTDATISDRLCCGLLVSNVSLCASMPAPFLAWVFGMTVLEPLVAAFLANLLAPEESESLRLLLASSVPIRSSLANLLVKRLDARRSPDVLSAIQLFAQNGGDDAVSLLAFKGLIKVLQKWSWSEPEECRWLSEMCMHLLKCENVLDGVNAAALLCQSVSVGLLGPLELLAWLNASNLAMSAVGADPASFLAAYSNPDWQHSDEALCLAHLQFVALTHSEWRSDLLSACLEHLASVSGSEWVLVAALGVIWRMLAHGSAANQPSLDSLYNLWLRLLALVVSDGRESVRSAVVKCLEAFFRMSRKAEHLTCLPWARFVWRFAVEKFFSNPSSASLMHLLQVFLPLMVEEEDRALVDGNLLCRVVLDCGGDDGRILALLVGLLDGAYPMDRSAIREACCSVLNRARRRNRRNVLTKNVGGAAIVLHPWDDEDGAVELRNVQRIRHEFNLE
jgi:hypothetical protein